jgi:hypothetical protein
MQHAVTQDVIIHIHKDFSFVCRLQDGKTTSPVIPNAQRRTDNAAPGSSLCKLHALHVYL